MSRISRCMICEQDIAVSNYPTINSAAAAGRTQSAVVVHWAPPLVMHLGLGLGLAWLDHLPEIQPISLLTDNLLVVYLVLDPQ